MGNRWTGKPDFPEMGSAGAENPGFVEEMGTFSEIYKAFRLILFETSSSKFIFEFSTRRVSSVTQSEITPDSIFLIAIVSPSNSQVSGIVI